MSTQPAAPPNVKLVVCDVDGTLLGPQKNLTPGAPAAVQRLKQAGILFTLTSARPPRLVQALIRELRVIEPVACFNGALIIDPDMTVMHELPMDRGDAQKVADHIFDKGLDLWVYTRSDWYVSNPTGPHVQHQQGLMNCKATPLRSHDVSQFHVLKMVGVSDNYPLVEQAQNELDSLCCISVSATRSSHYYLDVTHSDANKGSVIVLLSHMLKIPTFQIASIGDMDTDVLGFKKSGVSIAMGNATEEVKKQATYVTRSNTEDGFVWAMDHFILAQATKQVAAD